ncbi:MAG: cupin domain-containing protein [Oscillospiraceae bacterium]|nr:cupin domain-containing protein [Oscillospiraceae bacterium]
MLILDGEGEVRCGGEAVRAKKGDSLFLPAGSGEVRLTGTLRALATCI